MTDEGLGLREQKRRATRRALQIALLEGALERGFDAVTIDEVCRAAQVSPRTFFNYFATKEEAVAGAPGSFQVDEAQLREYVAGSADVVTDLVRLIAANIGDEDDVEVHRLRRQVLEREPQLLGLRMAETQRFHAVLADLAAQRLNGPAAPPMAEAERADRITLVALTVASIVRHGWRRWVASGGERALGDSVLASFAEFRDLAGEVVASAGAPAR
jgi:AcrR family transcriptional regulator